MAAWPGTLPQYFLVESLSFQRQKQSDALPTDVGPTISRRRFTASSEFFIGSMHMTPAQWDIVEAFYKDTLLGGSQKFDWVHPITQAAKELRFDIRQEEDLAIVRIIRPDKWVIRMAFEILP